MFVQRHKKTFHQYQIYLLYLYILYIYICKQLKNSREGRCVTRMFWGPFLVDRMMGG